MTTIMVPAHLPPIAPIEATAAGIGVTSSLRSVATTMSDVSEAMAADGAPEDWTGEAQPNPREANTAECSSPGRPSDLRASGRSGPC